MGFPADRDRPDRSPASAIRCSHCGGAAQTGAPDGSEDETSACDNREVGEESGSHQLLGLGERDLVLARKLDVVLKGIAPACERTLVRGSVSYRHLVAIAHSGKVTTYA